MCYYRKMLCRDVGHFSQMKFWFLDSFRFTEKLRRYYQAFILVYLAGSFSCYWHLIFIWYICYSSCTTTETLSVKVHLYLYVYFNVFIFNWRIIALQYCLGFCHTSTWIRHRYTYVPSLLTLSPTSHPSELLQSPSLSSLSHMANSHWLFILHTVVYMLPCSSPFVPPSPSSTCPCP